MEAWSRRGMAYGVFERIIFSAWHKMENGRTGKDA